MSVVSFNPKRESFLQYESGRNSQRFLRTYGKTTVLFSFFAKASHTRNGFLLMSRNANVICTETRCAFAKGSKTAQDIVQRYREWLREGFPAPEPHADFTGFLSVNARGYVESALRDPRCVWRIANDITESLAACEYSTFSMIDQSPDAHVLRIHTGATCAWVERGRIVALLGVDRRGGIGVWNYAKVANLGQLEAALTFDVDRVDRWCVNSIWVCPKMRRKGLASRLLVHATKDLGADQHDLCWASPFTEVGLRFVRTLSPGSCRL